MSECTAHREFLGALADGESQLVPAATVAHVRECAECTREIELHQMLTARIRAARDHLDEVVIIPRKTATARRRAALIAAALVGIALVAGAALAWGALIAPDPVRAAVQASSGSLQIRSSDPSQVAAWCLNASGRSLPVIELDGMQIVGARMDRVPNTDIVTVTYVTPNAIQVTVGWLEGQSPTGTGIKEMNVSGHDVLLVHTSRGTAVVTSSSVSAMWGAAASIEATAA